MQKICHLATIFTIGLWSSGILLPSQPILVSQPAFAAPEHGDIADTETVLAGDDNLHEPAGITDFNPWIYVWQLVLFIALFVVLAIFVWPQILKSLKAREQKQRGDLLTAENAAKEATATLEQYKQQLAEARKEAMQIVEQSKGDAQRVAAQLKEQAETELNQLRDRAQTDIRSAQEQAISAIYEETANLVTRVAGQVLKREIDPAAHQALINESLQQISTDRN